MKKLAYWIHARHKNFWTKENIFSLLVGIVLLLIALYLQGMADKYVVRTGGTVVGDILLDNIPALDIDGVIILDTLLFTLVVIIMLLLKPKFMIFTVKSLALFVMIRAFFISLTHLGIPPHQIVFNPNAFGFWLYDVFFNSTNDFFFSGHTGLPFLIALVFYHEKHWRYIYFAISIIFGISVLVGHIHYSIDVFAAPFITYSIFSIARILFKRDYKLVIS